MAQSDLIPFDKRSEAEAKELGKRGGINSGKARREKRKMRELLELALAETKKDRNGDEISKKVAGAKNLASKYANGDLKAIELASKLLGEWEEKHKVDVSTLDLKFEVVKK